MIARGFVLAAAISAMIATPVLGQGLGSHIRKSSDARNDIHDNDPDAAEKAANFFARCTAELRSPVAKKILDLPYMDSAQKKLARSKVSHGEECMDRLGYRLKSDYPPLVGGMAEYYVTDVFSDDSIALIAGTGNSDQVSVSPKPRNSAEIFSQCVARKDARAVKNFISAVPASGAEKQALQVVIPLLGQCIPAGEKIELDKISLRAMLSFGLYRELAAVVATDIQPTVKNAGSQ